MVHNTFRYQDYFQEPDHVIDRYFAEIPFLNGGLFECLDRRDENEPEVRIDGFSNNLKNPLSVPNELFFGDLQDVDLNADFGTSRKKYQVRGLIEIFKSYKFTIAENTPFEENVALDPELLGQVFENLLAAYNPETQTTARKQTGSFYTPREIVNYMVDESLIAYLKNQIDPPQPPLERQGGFIFGKVRRKGSVEKIKGRKVRKNKNRREYQRLVELD
jgi:type I restriction-modification system DNA methylase subunit